MSTKKDKHPVPEERLQHFMGIIWSMVEPFGVEDIPEVMDYVRLLNDSVERHLFEKRYKVSPQKKVNDDRKKYIAIFKQRYLEFTDLEYTRPVSAVEGKLIKQANKTLQDAGFSCEDYLKWTFEVFFDENPKFAPGNIKQTCGEHFLHKFLVDHKEEREQRQKDELAKKEGLAQMNKARQLMRETDSKENKEKIRSLVKQYGDGSIMLSEFRKGLNKLANS
jgi:hypothetical protein